MKKVLSFVIIVFILLLSQAANVSGQAGTTDLSHFGIVEVDIRPEFESTNVLVIYHIVLTRDTQLPAQVTIRLPDRVKEPNAVAWVDPADGGLYNLAYQTSSDAEWLYVTFSTTGNEVWFEYYDPALNKKDTARAYTFEWLGDFQVDDFRFYFLPPGGAQNTLITPDLGASQKDADGNLYYFKQLGSIKSGNTFKIKMTYDRTTDAISAENLVLEPAGVIDDTTKGRTSINELLPWLAALLLVTLTGFIGWWIWLSRKSSSKGDSRTSRHTPAHTQEGREERKGEFVYCHQCGERATRGDLFCRSCGIKLPRE